MRYNMVVIALSLLLLASCGEKPESSQATDAGKASVAQGPRQAALIRAGNSGLIPAQPGFVEVDAGSIQAAKSLRLCAVDRINDQKAVGQAIALTGADRIKVGGWALTPDKRSPASVAVVLQGGDKAYALRADAGRLRADVARAMKSDKAGRAGYSAESNLQGVAPGEYAVSVLQDTGGAPTICASGLKVAVAGE